MRIFNQFGVEVIGAKSPLLDVETIALGWSFISALGLKDMKVLINTLGDDASRAAYREALKEHFKTILTICVQTASVAMSRIRCVFWIVRLIMIWIS